MSWTTALALAALQLPSAADRWHLSAEDHGLTAEIRTELGHGAEISLIFYCSSGGRSSMIGRQGDFGNPEFQRYLDSLVGPGDPSVETYKAGRRTSRFTVTGPHPEGARDPVTDALLNSVQEADFVLLVGGSRPVLLPTTNASTVIAQFIAACSVLRPTN